VRVSVTTALINRFRMFIHWRFKLARVYAVSLLMMALAIDIEAGQSAGHRPKTSDALDAEVALARAAPPEYAAAALLRIARRAEKEQQSLLLEDVYRYAEGAVISAPWRSPAAVGSAEALEATASSYGMDRVTLQSGAVKWLLTHDPHGARHLLLGIKLPDASVSCPGLRFYDLTSFYDAASAVVLTSFSREEVANGEELLLARQVVRGFQSSAELEGVIRFVERMRASRMARERSDILVVELLSGLASGRGIDPAGFNQLRRLTAKLVRLRERVDEAASETLLAAVRAYALRQLQAPRCAETSTFRAKELAALNDILCGAIVESCRHRIEREHLSSSAVLPAVSVSGRDLWSTPEAIAARTAFRRLVFVPRSKSPLLPRRSDSDTTEWAEECDAFLRSLEGWQPSVGTSRAVPLEKLALLRGLIPSTPDGGLRRRAVALYFDATDDLEPHDRKGPLWFLYARELPNLLLTLDSDTRRAFEVRIARDPVLRVHSYLRRSHF
jgi:hypothetical protein